jgi:glycosyltransferase involved in cell wall biosynthesis
MTATAYDIEITERIPRVPPVIPVVPEGISRPHWSVMIPVYNCSRYLPAALESVVWQGERSMQIEVVDDCSTDDDVEALIQKFGNGRVAYFRQPENVGSLRNFHTCLLRAKGQLIHLLHGDDCVKKGFYRQIEKLYGQYPSAGAAFCRYDYINAEGEIMYSQEKEADHEGILEDWLEKLCERQRIQYASIVVKREVYEHLGGFYGTEYGEDWEMWARIAAHYPIAYTPDILAQYRRHTDSISGKSFVSAKNMEDLSSVMEKIRQYLPREKQQSVLQESRKFYAHYALKTANALWADLGNKGGATAQVRQAWRMHKDPMLLYKIMKLLTRMTLNI